MLDCFPTCGLLRRNGAHPREMADSRALSTARRIHIRRRVAVLRDSSHFRGLRPAVGGEASRAVHPRELGKRRMRSSLASGKSSTPPARCIHSPQRYTSSAEYHLLVSRASCGASRELSSRRSPALIPHTCAVSPTFLYGAFLFVASALADLSSSRLTARGKSDAATVRKQAFYKRFVGCRVERSAPCYRVRPPPHRTVRAGFPHTALRVRPVTCHFRLH